jgi:hypothetical protein
MDDREYIKHETEAQNKVSQLEQDSKWHKTFMFVHFCAGVNSWMIIPILFPVLSDLVKVATVIGL